MTITILASTIPPVIPPINEPGFDITLRLQGCQSLITRTLPGDSSNDAIRTAALSMQAEWAGQQANCNTIATAGVNCDTGSGFLNICNDAQTIDCPGFGPIFVPAGLYCDRLNITGLNQGQIAAAVALVKARLNQLAIGQICPAFGTFCNIIVNNNGPGGAGIDIFVHNQSATLAFDSSTIQFCDIGGTPLFTSVIPSVAPLGVSDVISFSGASGLNPFKIKNHGVVVFTVNTGAGGFDRRVDMFANC